MLRPGDVGMRGSMVIRLRPCVRSSTSLLSSTPPPLPLHSPSPPPPTPAGSRTQVLDPASPTSPGWGDGRCNRVVQCMSFRVNLEMATQGLRVGVRVKASSLEKAKVPAGTVRLLELFFRGSVSVRAELRNEFPFVTTVS